MYSNNQEPEPSVIISAYVKLILSCRVIIAWHHQMGLGENSDSFSFIGHRNAFSETPGIFHGRNQTYTKIIMYFKLSIKIIVYYY